LGFFEFYLWKEFAPEVESFFANLLTHWGAFANCFFDAENPSLRSLRFPLQFTLSHWVNEDHLEIPLKSAPAINLIQAICSNKA
jgi:hypothetical protein